MTATLRRYLRAWGCGSVDVADSGATAATLLAQARYDIVLLDLHFDGDWRSVLAMTQTSSEPSLALVISGTADIKTAVEAMRLGAADFIEKPIEAKALLARLEVALESTGPNRQAPARRSGYRAKHRAPTSESMQKALALADRVAATPSSSALIVGESGVGKEVLAARVHERSARRDGPFVRVNLAAIPPNVIEAELFGSTRGAFTDAKRDRAGYLASADGGTILLDEIGEFRLDLQAKLLRAIEERRFYPVGSDKERSIDVRILAATNRSPDELVDANILRSDLFYRLGTIIRIPPLRERLDEIHPIATELVEHFSHEFGRGPCTLTKAALDVLLTHTWPGNIRELRNVIERAVMMCEGDEITADLVEPGSASRNTSLASLRLEDARGQSVDRIEREHIIRVLKLAGDSKSAAASLLGVSRSTLYEKLKRYGITS
ncbi:MAG: sigma-54-dependent Fis family transcriptional regulator [Labilithrix sp.]|nr:sigma-54-dependent Fis family transcriptional regulator [Labilithrix sp.]MCW5812831.1 sigma-54-dependent Fis family transcriptional regulator [Labilithrix sp.]